MKKVNLIKTNRFKTIEVNLTFIMTFKKEYIPYAALLNTLLLKTSLKYKENIEIVKELENLYSANVYSKYSVSGNLFLIDYSLTFISPKYTEDKMYANSFKLFEELLFNPNVKNNKFSKKEFNIYKSILLQNIDGLTEQNTVVAESNYNKIMFKGTPYEHTPLKLKNIYETIDEKTLFNFYKEVIENENYIINVIGDFDEDKINKHIKKIQNKLSKKEKQLPNLLLKELKTNEVIEKCDKRNSNQSMLLIGYAFNNLTEFERKYVLTFYNLILGSMNNSVLFVNVREKNSLCYGISSYIHKYASSLTVECGINKSNYNLAVEEIKKSIKLMSNKKEIESMYENAINTINLSLNDYYEDVGKQILHHVFKEFDESDDIEVKREKFSKVSVDDIVNLNKKMKLKTIYFLEGTNERD